MLLGGYPVVHAQPVTLVDWFASHVATDLERDRRQVLNVQDLGTFQRFPGLPADLSSWRDNNGLEADLVFEMGTRPQPVAIKSGQTVTRDYITADRASARFAGNEALPPWLIYGRIESCERSGLRVIGWRDITAAVSPTPT